MRRTYQVQSLLFNLYLYLFPLHTWAGAESETFLVNKHGVITYQGALLSQRLRTWCMSITA